MNYLDGSVSVDKNTPIKVARARAAKIVLQRRKARKEMTPEYVHAVFNSVDPGATFLPNWHIDCISEHLEACHERQIRQLIINVPPRYLKSILVSVAWPASILGRDPSAQILSASYSSDLAMKHSVDCRNVIQSEWHQELFPALEISRDENIKLDWHLAPNALTKGRGYRISAGVGGSITGKGGNYLIIDDPHKPALTTSGGEIKKGVEWYKSVFSTRLNDKKWGVKVLIMQRLAEYDLTAHLLEQGGWHHLCIPAIGEEPVLFHIRNFSYQRKAKEILHPEREDKPEIAQAKRDLGSAFWGQYQQRPVPAEGQLLKRHYWKRYVGSPRSVYEDFDWDDLIHSWDMSFKDKETSCYVVGQFWGRIGADHYLLDEYRERMDFGATCKAVMMMERKWPNYYGNYVEDKANGPAVISALQRILPRMVPVEPYGSKEARVQAVLPLFQAGNVWLPLEEHCTWINDYIDELADFPKGKYDDRVDSTSQALDQMSKRRSAISAGVGDSRSEEQKLNDLNVSVEDILGV